MIIKKNKNSGAEIFSVSGRKSDRVQLELISPEGLKLKGEYISSRPTSLPC